MLRAVRYVPYVIIADLEIEKTARDRLAVLGSLG